ncbi:alpha/beta hydrolase [Paenibacillus sp. FSL R5-0744]|uniref:alpha/beta fold hydrolase n=1 Tax=Paenibacillus sp. FSL R5-0744 TaxID=2921656 RepID=UPI0030DAC4CD
MVNSFKNAKAQERVWHSYEQMIEQWPIPLEELDVPTTYGLTHCILAGQKNNPPLLLFHGVGDNSAVMWILNIEELSKHFYCIAIDTLGGPGKSIPTEQFNKQKFEQVKWINEIAMYLNIDVFNIAGVSNGAYIAFNYATKQPDKVNRVVCLEGGMVTAPFKAMIQTLMMMFPEILIPTDRNLLKVLKKLSAPHSPLFDNHPALAAHLILLMRTHNQQAMFVHKLHPYDKNAAVAVRDKLYFLVGEHALKQSKDFIKILEDGKFYYQVIPHAGHGINHEQPDRVNTEIINFLIDDKDKSLASR